MTAETSPPPPGESLTRRVLRGAAYLGVAQYATFFIGLIKTPILARLVAPELFGAVALATSWVSFLQVFRMELREVVISDPKGDQARLTTQYAIEIATSLTGVVFGLALWFVIPGLASAAVWTAIFALLATRVVFAVTSTPLYILHRDIRQDVITRLTLAGVIASLVLSATLAWLEYPLAALLADVITPVVVLGIGSWIAVRWQPTRGWSRDVARDVMGFALTMWTGGIFGKISFELDDWLVGQLQNLKALGYYQKAYTLAKMPMDVFAGVIGGIALSTYSQAQAEGGETLSRTYHWLTWLLLRVVAWSSIVVLAAAEEIVLIFLGPKWGFVPLLLRLMFVYVLGRPLFQNNAQLLIAMRQEKLYRRSQFVQALLLVLLAPPLVYVWGARGASIAVNVMMIGGLALSQWDVSKRVNTELARLYVLPTLLVLILTPGAYWLGGLTEVEVLVPALGKTVDAGVLLPLAVKGGTVTLAFAGVTYLLEREMVHRVYGLVREHLLGGVEEDNGA